MKKILLALFVLVTVDGYAQERNSSVNEREEYYNQIMGDKRQEIQNERRRQKNINFVWQYHRSPSFIEELTDGQQSFGVIYNYGKYFPIGISLNYSYSMFMASLDFGLNTDKDKYVSKEINSYIDENNYSYTTTSLDPKFYLSLTPQFYLKYFSIGCGIGYLFMSKDVDDDISYGGSESTSSGNGSVSVSTSSSVSSSVSMSTSGDVSGRFMIRPTVKGFIPLSEDISLVISAGYDYVFKFKEKNGFNAGLGLQWTLY